MCDTLWKNSDKGIFFAKNSDRGCNEPNLTVFIKGGKQIEKSLQCTYISIPQVENTNSVLLVKPSWIWGAEIGTNEQGVTIGNEAVFTRSKDKKTEKLLGMDMLRIALERGNSAKVALDIIINLLKTYGQGGNCGFDKSFYYDNSFLITDKVEGYILETAGNEYVVKTLEDFGNISNRLSINGEFSAKNSEPIFSFFSGSKQRRQSGGECISKSAKIKDVFNSLRSHDTDDEKKLFMKGSVKSVCMHQSLLGDQTTGSMVVHFGKAPSIWITGASSPCLSIFKPTMFGEKTAPVFVNEEDSLKYWLKREYLNRAIFCGFVHADDFRKEANALEDDFIKKYEDAINNNATTEQMRALCEECSRRENEFIDSYKDIIEGVKSGKVELKGQWKTRTERLGHNVFAQDLQSRKA
ncbi:MAG TPA: hypothetical protein VJZ69_05640 [Clostridia bacterium]|nr:hypothetical protein [Clostridia bacterium]